MNQGMDINNFQLGFDTAHDGVLDFPLLLFQSIISPLDTTPTSHILLIFVRISGFSLLLTCTEYLVTGILLPLLKSYFRLLPILQPIVSLQWSNKALPPTVLVCFLQGAWDRFGFSLDANMTWNKPELLDKATIANVLGIRVGKVFTFKRRPHSNISIWIGTMFVAMQSETKGTIKLAEGLPPDVWDKKDQFVADYWNRYDKEATPVRKKFADRVLTPIVDAIDQRNGESIVSYGMAKPTGPWNGIVGIQHQIDKHWQLRSEGGVTGDRKSFMLSHNYRFLRFRKKIKTRLFTTLSAISWKSWLS